ncbi:MAG TPA: cation:proton antiporter, partial [Bacteroidales bacterium]|nr:cation:proton antiporter [Bacteroidales bacterium]
MMIQKKSILLIPRLLLIIIFTAGTSQNLIHAQDHKQEIEQTITQEELTNTTEHELSQSEDSGHSSDMSPLFFLIIALIIGAATKHFLKKSPLPYTVSLLIIGLGLGALTRLGYFGNWNLLLFKLDTNSIGKAIAWAGHIDPHLILYIFLPTLIFEAAFAMDVHTFKKSFA